MYLNFSAGNIKCSQPVMAFRPYLTRTHLCTHTHTHNSRAWNRVAVLWPSKIQQLIFSPTPLADNFLPLFACIYYTYLFPLINIS